MSTTEKNIFNLLIGCVAIIAVLSLLLEPRLQIALFPSLRFARLKSLIADVHTSRNLDTLQFWQTRDEYGSGFFSLASDHTIFRESQELVLPSNNQLIKFANYQSKFVASQDYLTPWTDLPRTRYTEFLDQVVDRYIPPTQSIFQDETQRIFLNKDNQLVIAFVKPISEMAKVYGLYNFPDANLDGRLWMNVTTFKPNCCSLELQGLTEAALKTK